RRDEDAVRARGHDLALQLVGVGRARDCFEQGVAAKYHVLDRALGNRRQRENDRETFHYEPPRALAAGIGAVRVFAPSRSRSLFPSEFASASAAAADGSETATVTGMLAEAVSNRSGARPTSSTRRPR